MNEAIQGLIDDLHELQGELKGLRAQRGVKKEELVGAKDKGQEIYLAQEIIQKVGLETQKQIQLKLTSLISHALQVIFEQNYQCHLDYQIKRSRSEASFTISRDGGEKINPKDASGGGVIDIMAFILRIILWSIDPDRTRNTMILDEPFRCVSTDLQPKVAEVLSEISNKMGLQFLIITHEEELTDCAGKIFTTRMKNGRTYLK